jgi:hypothetical protein
VRIAYGAADAERAGLLKKGGPWTQYRTDMMSWAAVKRVCRLGAPDLINAISGIDVGEAGEMMDDLPDESSPVIDIEALPAAGLANKGDESPVEGLPAADETVEEEAGQEPEPAPEPEPPTAPHFKNIRDLFKQAIQELKYKNIADILATLECRAETDIADLERAWAVLVHRARA